MKYPSKSWRTIRYNIFWGVFSDNSRAGPLFWEIYESEMMQMYMGYVMHQGEFIIAAAVVVRLRVLVLLACVYFLEY